MNRIATVAITLIATAAFAVSAFAQGKPHTAPAKSPVTQSVAKPAKATPSVKHTAKAKSATMVKAAAKSSKAPKKPARKPVRKHVVLHHAKSRTNTHNAKATSHKAVPKNVHMTAKTKTAPVTKKAAAPTKPKTKRSEVQRQ